MAKLPVPARSVRVKPVGDDTDQKLLYKICAVLATGEGLGGVDIISDASPHAGDWWILHAISDTIIASATYASGTSSGSLSGVTVKAGDRIYGNFSSITLTSGTAELYRPAI